MMATCTFFGHRDTPKKIEPILRSTPIDLIENKHIDKFYVGSNGAFDNMVRESLQLLKFDYPNIDYAVVLAYMPVKKDALKRENNSDTIYPDGLESTPPKYAVIKRNKWMLNKSDYVVAYVKHSGGGAAKFKELAEKKGIPVLNLAAMT